MAARKFLGNFASSGDPTPFMDATGLLVFAKGTDSHAYKFSTAELEDYALVSPAWRDQYVAAGLHHCRTPNEPDTGVLKRTRAAPKS